MELFLFVHLYFQSFPTQKMTVEQWQINMFKFLRLISVFYIYFFFQFVDSKTIDHEHNLIRKLKNQNCFKMTFNLDSKQKSFRIVDQQNNLIKLDFEGHVLQTLVIQSNQNSTQIIQISSDLLVVSSYSQNKKNGRKTQTNTIKLFNYLQNSTYFLKPSKNHIKLISQQHNLIILYQDGQLGYFSFKHPSKPSTNLYTNPTTSKYLVNSQNQTSQLMRVAQVNNETNQSLNSSKFLYNKREYVVSELFTYVRVLQPLSNSRKYTLENMPLQLDVDQQVLSILDLNFDINTSRPILKLVNLDKISHYKSLLNMTARFSVKDFIYERYLEDLTQNKKVLQKYKEFDRNSNNAKLAISLSYNILTSPKLLILINNYNHQFDQTDMTKILASQQLIFPQQGTSDDSKVGIQQSLDKLPSLISSKQVPSSDLSSRFNIWRPIVKMSVNIDGSKVIIQTQENFSYLCIFKSNTCNEISDSKYIENSHINFFGINSYVTANTNGIIKIFEDEGDFTRIPSQQNQKQITKSQVQFLEQVQRIINSTTFQTFQSFLSVPNLKQLLILLTPIYVFVDDFWFYSYHRGRNLSFNTRVAFRILKDINQARLYPQFLDPLISQTKQCTKIGDRLRRQSYANFTKPQFTQNEKMDIYFLANIQQLLVWNLPLVILIVLLFKLLRNCSILNKYPSLRLYLKLNSSWVVLLSSVIEVNIQFFSYMAFQQLQNSFFFGANDKLNFILCLSVLFVVLVFCLCGYLLIHSLSSITSAYVFIDGMKNIRQSYILIMLIQTLRCFSSGFTHSYLYQQKQIQNVLILFIDFSSIAITINVNQRRNTNLSKQYTCKNRQVYIFYKTSNPATFYTLFLTRYNQCFNSRVTVILYQIYYGGKFLFDILILYELHNFDSTGNTQIIQFYMVFLLIASTILRVIWHFVLSVEEKICPSINRKLEQKIQVENASQDHKKQIGQNTNPQPESDEYGHMKTRIIQFKIKRTTRNIKLNDKSTYLYPTMKQTDYSMISPVNIHKNHQDINTNLKMNQFRSTYKTHPTKYTETPFEDSLQPNYLRNLTYKPKHKLYTRKNNLKTNNSNIIKFDKPQDEHTLSHSNQINNKNRKILTERTIGMKSTYIQKSNKVAPMCVRQVDIQAARIDIQNIIDQGVQGRKAYVFKLNRKFNYKSTKNIITGKTQSNIKFCGDVD